MSDFWNTFDPKHCRKSGRCRDCGRLTYFDNRDNEYHHRTNKRFGCDSIPDEPDDIKSAPDLFKSKEVQGQLNLV